MNQLTTMEQPLLNSKQTVCSTCRYAFRYSTDGEHLSLLSCRRHAPTRIQLADATFNSGWPSVYHDSWCGEWEPSSTYIATQQEQECNWLEQLWNQDPAAARDFMQHVTQQPASVEEPSKPNRTSTYDDP